MSAPETIVVRDAPERSRYEAEGRGVGGALARAALDDARARGLRVVPRCPFMAAYIRRHPEHRDLVPGDALGLLEPPARR